MLTERELILANLDAFVRQRSGTEPGNYGSWLRRYFKREFGRGIASRYFD